MDSEKLQKLVLQQFNKVFNKLDLLEKGQQDMRKDLTKLETRIENEVIDKVKALYDGYSLRGEQIENLVKTP